MVYFLINRRQLRIHLYDRPSDQLKLNDSIRARALSPTQQIIIDAVVFRLATKQIENVEKGQFRAAHIEKNVKQIYYKLCLCNGITCKLHDASISSASSASSLLCIYHLHQPLLCIQYSVYDAFIAINSIGISSQQTLDPRRQLIN